MLYSLNFLVLTIEIHLDEKRLAAQKNLLNMKFSKINYLIKVFQRDLDKSMFSYHKCPLQPPERQKRKKIPPLAVNNGKTVRFLRFLHK